jgi:antitoxin YefM
MQSIYRVRAADLTSDFITALQYVYKDREIEIVVSDVVDETDYLLGTDANREHLIAAMKNIEVGEDLVSLSLDSLPSA